MGQLVSKSAAPAEQAAAAPAAATKVGNHTYLRSGGRAALATRPPAKRQRADQFANPYPKPLLRPRATQPAAGASSAAPSVVDINKQIGAALDAAAGKTKKPAVNAAALKKKVRFLAALIAITSFRSPSWLRSMSLAL